MGLATKQKLFAEYYLESYNGTQAAIQAGYTPNSAATIAWRLLRKEEILELINQRIEVAAMSANERLITLSDIARDKEERTGDRLKAIEMLGKLAGDYTERVQYQSVDLSELSDAELEAIVGGGKV